MLLGGWNDCWLSVVVVGMKSEDAESHKGLADALQLAVLSAFAVAQPIFDLLGKKPEFFAVRASQPMDLWLLAAALCLTLPLPLILVVMVSRAIDERLGRCIQGVLSTLLIAAILLPALDRALGAAPWLELCLALLAGSIGALFLDRWKTAKQLLKILLPVLIIFPAIFMLRPGMSKIWMPGTVDAIPATNATTPIVLLIFDELPLASLLAEPQVIDQHLYPNFAELAGESTWYYNSVTASDFTVLAVPAILTGQEPVPGQLPLAPEHPDSLFTLLGDQYTMNVAESVTQVCPPRLCDDTRRGSGVWARLRSLFSDTKILYLHTLLPKAWSDQLPPVTQNWMLFEGEGDWIADWKRRGNSDKVARLNSFLSGITETTEPVLHMLHLLLPHGPFVHLPSGQTYSFSGAPIGVTDDKMARDEWAATQSQQRHLLQLGYVDQVLGTVKSRLESVGLWDRSVVVVTADHGASFATRSHHRQLTNTNFPAIAQVPLMIKAPGQTEGALDLRAASSTDILPTIADLIGADIPQSDGVSLSTQDGPTRHQLHVIRHGRRHEDSEPFEVLVADLKLGIDSAMTQLQERFGASNETGRELYAIGPHREWIGRSVTEFQIAEPTPYSFQLKVPAAALDVDPDGWLVPAHLHGKLIDAELSAPVDLAVVVNGKIAAITRSWMFEPTNWSAVVNPTVFASGSNRVELMALSFDQQSPSPRLHPISGIHGTTRPPIAGLFEQGLYPPEEWPDAFVRWTNGDAQVTLPVRSSRPPKELSISLLGNHPGGGLLRISANGTPLLETRLAPLIEPWSKTLDLSEVDLGDELTIRIESSSFIPLELSDETQDGRRLGVAVSGFELSTL